MKKFILLIVTGILITGIASAGEKLRIMENLVMPSRILGQDVRFSVCLPEDYHSGIRRYPVTYLLHGLGDDSSAWLEYGMISHYADEAVRSGDAAPMIFVMPDGYRTYYVNDYKGTFRYQDMFVNELVPYIDSLFRTLPDRQHRALMGYSMGGFGALILHLLHPDVFGTAVPLSISVRTDEQYKTEDPAGWNDQWGRLFGEPGLTGDARITPYYRQNSPFHVLRSMPDSDIRKLNIYIDNGDKEQTLCRSNEELHMLMHELGIPHEFRVRDGGHSFAYWRSALPDAMRFISDAFESRPYRGDKKQTPAPDTLAAGPFRTFRSGDLQISAVLPADYPVTSRLYPVIYFAGNFSRKEQLAVGAVLNREVLAGKAGPAILVFPGDCTGSQLERAIPGIEAELRIRPGYRFRTLACYRAESLVPYTPVINSLPFCGCFLADSRIGPDEFAAFLPGLTPEAGKRIQFFIVAPDKGNHCEGNGNAHILLRDKEIQHEYRVREGDGGFGWLIGALPEMIGFASIRFHK